MTEAYFDHNLEMAGIEPQAFYMRSTRSAVDRHPLCYFNRTSVQPIPEALRNGRRDK